MSQSVENRLHRVMLVVALGVAIAGLFFWWTTSARVSLADDSPLSGSVKTAEPATVQPGSLVTYTIVLSNSSPISSVSVLVSDPLPPSLGYVSGTIHTVPDDSGVVLADTGSITWTVVVSPATSVALTFQAQVSAWASGGTVITNTAAISDSSTLVELNRSAPVTVVGGYTVFMPLVFRRWPPTPYAPTLNEISNDDGDGNYTVSWSYGDHPDAPVNTYTLQEATNADFTANQIIYSPGSNTTQVISSKNPGTYYYRVQGNNTWGPGDWSEVRSVAVRSPLRDDFNDPSTGWTARRTSAPDIGMMASEYSEGRFVTRVEDRFDFGIFSPMQRAPTPPYSIRMRTRIIHLANLVSYGIIFGGNGGTVCPVQRDNAGDPNGCFYHYYRLNVVWGGDYLKYELKRIDYHEGGEIGRGKGRGVELVEYTWIDNVTSSGGWNDWKIEVYSNGFAVYVNGHLLTREYDTTYVNEPYFGIFSSTNEYNGARFEHEYFYVDPLPSTAALPESEANSDYGTGAPDEVYRYWPLP